MRNLFNYSLLRFKKLRDFCLIEEDEEWGSLKIRLRHIVTETHKLTIYEGLEDFGDLYDRINDPDELNNLWYDEESKLLREKLRNKLFYEYLKIQSRYPRKISST